jgi:hypothetical protein
MELGVRCPTTKTPVSAFTFSAIAPLHRHLRLFQTEPEHKLIGQKELAFRAHLCGACRNLLARKRTSHWIILPPARRSRVFH